MTRISETLRSPVWAAVFCLLSQFSCFATNTPPNGVADVAVRIKLLSWNTGTNGPRELTCTNRCVVGTNSWLIESDYAVNTKNTYRFDGRSILEQRQVVLKPPTVLSEGVHYPKAGEPFTRRVESVDGNPGRPPRVTDEMDFMARVVWLAFCSAPCLSRQDHNLYPPNELWKEYMSDTRFAESTVRFEDSLGLPKLLLLMKEERQPVIEYRVAASTNFCGWNFPTEFFLAQYRSTGTKGWMLDYLAKGEVISINPGSKSGLQAK